MLVKSREDVRRILIHRIDQLTPNVVERFPIGVSRQLDELPARLKDGSYRPLPTIPGSCT